MAERQETFRNFGFFLEMQGERAGFFSRVEHLGMQIECIEHYEGGAPGMVQKLPGRTRINDVELSHGITQSDSLWRWLDSAARGQVERRNVSIVLLASDGQTPAARWDLGNAWLRGCRIDSFDARGNEVLIAHMCLTAETLARCQGAK